MGAAEVMRVVVLAAIVGACVACGSSSGDGGATTQDSGNDGATTETSPCASGESLQDDGHCEPAGVPPSACGDGFASDGDRGCVATLPSDPCGAGQMAIPGETSCHDVAPCADGTWGDVPVEASTQFVDASFTGTSDGSSKAPWKTIGEGVRAAAPKAIVAIAAGKYAEDVHVGGTILSGSPVRLWGRCPSMVEIAATGADVAGIVIGRGANGAEVHGVSVHGTGSGISVIGATGVVIEHVWIHDATHRGVDVEDAVAASSVDLRDSLVESSVDVGVYVSGADAKIDGVVVRGTLPLADKTHGRGVQVQADGSQRSTATLHATIVEGSRDVGVLVIGSDVTLDSTLVRDTQPRESDKTAGRGISVQTSDPALRATANVRACVVERNHEVGISVAGGDLVMESTTVRDTLSQEADGWSGRGVVAQDSNTDHSPSSAKIHACLVEKSFEVGLLVVSSDATVDGVVVRDVAARPIDGLIGDAVLAVSYHGPATLAVGGSSISGAARAGLASFGAAVTVSGTRLDCNVIHIDGEGYSGNAYAFTDDGGNVCGCGATAPVPCQILSDGIAVPENVP